MNPSLSPQEKWLIERELIAKEEAKEKKNQFRSRVFIIGIIAGCLAATLTIFFGGFFIPLIPKLTWIVCCIIYTDFHCIALSYTKDSNISHLVNPWKESMEHFSDRKDILRGLSLFVCYTVSKVILLFVVSP